MRKLIPEELFILACAKIEPSFEDIERINNLVPQIKKWDYTLKLAIENGMAPLVYKKIPLLSNGIMIPEKVKQSLQQVYYKTLSYGTVLYQNFNEVAETFSNAGIDVIPLKGIFLADYLYRDIGLRQLSDIDILVREENIPECVDIMKGLGYVQEEEKSKFFEENVDYIHCSHIVKGIAKFDLHRKIHKENESYTVKIQDFWESATEVVVNGAPVLALDIHHLIIHLCIHLEKHFGLEIVQYKCFCDIVNLLDKHADKIDWGKLEGLCTKYNCTFTIFKYLMLTKEFFNVYLPDEIVNKHSKCLSKNVIKQFVRNFIHKNSWETTSVAQLKMKNGINEKMRYFFRTVFPPVKFMVDRYRIKYMLSVPYYYFYRLFTGLEQYFKYISRR
jgi:hypothetical protein